MIGDSAGEPEPEAERRVSERAQAKPSTIRVRLASVKWLLPRRLAVAVIRLYQLTISPMLGPACRFSPSCSHYAAECLHDHGLLRGSWLTLRRLSRCHPFHPGGYDPPPPALGNPQLGSPSTAASAEQCTTPTRM